MGDAGSGNQGTRLQLPHFPGKGSLPTIDLQLLAENGNTGKYV